MKRVLRWMVLFFLILIPQLIYAAEEPYELEEIVVTATRTERQIKDVPASVTVVTGDELKKKNIVTIDEALNDLAGVYVKRTKGLMDTTANINMRGFSGSEYVLVLVDGQPMNEAYTNNVMWANMPVEAIDRIEVIRGGASALYGQNAMGGVINIITKSADRTTAYVTGGYSTNDTRKLSAGLGTKVYDRLSFRFGYDEIITGGYETTPVVVTKSAGASTLTGGYAMDSATGQPTRWVIGDRGKNTAGRKNLNGKAVWDYSETGSLTVSTMQARMEYDYDLPNTYVGTFSDKTTRYTKAGDGFRAPVTGSSFISYTGKGTYDLQSYILSISDLLNHVKVNARAGLMLGDDRYTQPSTTSSKYTYWDAPGTMKVTQNQTWFAEMTGDIPFLNQHVLTLGGSYRLDSSDTDDYDIPYYRSYDNPSSSVNYVGGKTQNIGFFAQEEWHPADSFRLYIGARVDIWKGMDGQVKNYSTRDFQTFGDSSKTSFSPKIAAVYQPFDGTSIRASVGKSFRAPTVYEMYRTWISAGKTYHPNPYLDPETVWTYELGWEQALLNKKTTVSMSLFYNDIQDLIYNSTEGTNVYKKNAGSARTFSVEVGARHQLFSWISLFGNFTYTDAKIESNPTDPKSEGKRVTYIPEYMANAGADITYKWISGNVTAHYTSKIYGASDNSDIADGVYGTYEPSFTMDAKVMVSPWKWVDVSVGVTNMWNEKTYQYYQTEGRRVFVEATFRY